jgi:hypothetical protein
MVILYQIGIFFLMAYCAYKSITYLNIITFLIVIFTLIQVTNFSPLMFLQFITIFISYQFCLSRIKSSNTPISGRLATKKSVLELVLIIFFYFGTIILLGYGLILFCPYYFDVLDFSGNEWFFTVSGLIFLILILLFARLIFLVCFIKLKKTATELNERF